jgi:hypothetical protein
VNNRLGAGTGEGRDANVLHASVLSAVPGRSLAQLGRAEKQALIEGYSPRMRTGDQLAYQ